MAARPVDRILLFSILVLTLGGFFIFMSAALGLLTRDGAGFADVALGQFLFGVVGGLIALSITSVIPYRLYRRFAPILFGIAVALMLLVFAPGIGLELKGAHRWLDLGFATVQPAEVLKIAYVIYLGVWLSRKRMNVKRAADGLVPFLTLTGISAGILLMQPDTGTALVLIAGGGAMFAASGASLRDIIVLVVAGVLVFGAVVMARPYVLDRIATFLDPARDPRGSSYQVQQSLIAIGSGGAWGRGFGQSVQKFGYLPEPVGDSIFAVYAEEAGFAGALLVLLAFLVFGLRGLWIAARAPDVFGGLLAVGIVILVMAQSFLNMASMLGVFPLTGVPLVFISHGGTALLSALAASGILLNISRARRVG